MSKKSFLSFHTPGLSRSGVVICFSKVQRSPLVCDTKVTRTNATINTNYCSARHNSSLESPGYSRQVRQPARFQDAVENIGQPRLSRGVQATYLRPLRRKPQHGVAVCDLQLRSYSIRNLDIMTDFALRAAYYLELPAYGPVSLPRLVERWTLSRSSFIFKKSQENFERKTLRRLIQVKDGHPDTIQMWLAFIRNHAYHGIGMKANVWEHEKLDVARAMEMRLESSRNITDWQWGRFGRYKISDEKMST